MIIPGQGDITLYRNGRTAAVHLYENYTDPYTSTAVEMDPGDVRLIPLSEYNAGLNLYSISIGHLDFTTDTEAATQWPF